MAALNFSDLFITANPSTGRQRLFQIDDFATQHVGHYLSIEIIR